MSRGSRCSKPLPRPQADGAARTWALVLNVTGIAVTFWAAFWPEPYRMAILSCLLVPLAAMVAVPASGRRIKLVDRPRRRTPHVVLALLAPMVALLLRSLDFRVMTLQNALAPVAVIAMVLTLVTWRLARDSNDSAWKFLIVVPFLVSYSYGAIIEANGLLDSSRAVIFEVKVTDRRVVSGSRGGRTYYLKVSPWGLQAEDNEVSVSRRTYERVKVNDTVRIGVKRGYLNIPWYSVKV